MSSPRFIWLNGKFIPFKQAKIHLLTHSLHYGSAVFEGIRFYETKKGPAVFRLEDHLARLFLSAQTMEMKLRWTKNQLLKIILQLIQKNKLRSGYVRPIIFYGQKMGLDPAAANVNVGLAAWPWKKYLAKEVVKVKISSWRRLHPKTCSMAAKISGYYFNSVLATLEAKKAGYDEAILLDNHGYIAEGPGENIFFVKSQTIYTPRPQSILCGITRHTVIDLAKNLEYPVLEKNFRSTDLKNINESFFTGTAAEITAIGQIDKIKINQGKEGNVTHRLKKAYNMATRGEIKKYQNWLTYVS